MGSGSLTEVLLQSLLLLFTKFLSWRRQPENFEKTWQAGMRNSGQTYQKRLQGFDRFCRANKIRLLTPSDVDHAAALYTKNLGKGECSQLLSALVKSFPPLRGKMFYTAATVHARQLAEPSVHHRKIAWVVAVAIAGMARS